MSGIPPTTSLQRPEQINTSLSGQFVGLLFFSIFGWVLYRGWQLRTEHYITADKGAGYILGIVGGSLMLALLMYPVRKHTRAMRNWGPIHWWFRTHMVFGVLGPTLILFHANFGLGSLNSNVALICMILVASSGLVGRFFYSRIHYGLYGRKASLQELGDVVGDSRGHLAWIGEASKGFTARLQKIEKMAVTHSSGLLHSMLRWIRYHTTAWWHRLRLRWMLRCALRKTAKREQWDWRTKRMQRRQALKYLDTYFDATRKVLEFHFYERLFALWHVVHLPFFLMMLFSGIVHVIAVHMY